MSWPQHRSSGSTTGVIPMALRIAMEFFALGDVFEPMCLCDMSKWGRQPTKNMTSFFAVALCFTLRPFNQERRSCLSPSLAIIRIHEYICPDWVGLPSRPSVLASTRESRMKSEKRTLYGHRCSQVRQVRHSHSLSLIHISEPTRLGMISYAVFCLKKKKTVKR